MAPLGTDVLVTLFDALAVRSTAMVQSTAVVDVDGVQGVQVIGSNQLDVLGTLTITKGEDGPVLAATVSPGRAVIWTFSTREVGVAVPSSVRTYLSPPPEFTPHNPDGGTSCKGMLTGPGPLRFAFVARTPPNAGTITVAVQVTT